MSKQTAVEWLLVKICMLGVSEGDGLNIDEIIDQAKAMEREQIIDAALELICNEYQLEVATQDLIDSAEKYYNETYKGGEQ
jgi:predicted nucleic-acid-binding protein